MKANLISISTLCTLLLGTSFLKLNAQIVGLTYPNKKDECFKSVTPLKNGDLLLYGQTRDNSRESEDFKYWNISPKGDLNWFQNFGDIHHDYGCKSIRCKNDDIISFGTSWDGPFGRPDFFLTRFSPEMVPIWTHFFGDDHREDASSIVEFDNGDFLIAGVTKNDLNNPNPGNFYLLRISSNGNLIWEKKWGANKSRDVIYDIALDQNQDIYAVGGFRTTNCFSSFEFTEGNSLPYIAKLDGNGNIQWDSTYNFPGNNFFKRIAIDEQNNIIVGGDFQAYGNSFDNYLASIGPNGAIFWETSFGEISFDYLSDILIHQSQIYVVGTSCLDTTTFSTQGKLSKLDMNGNLLSTLLYGGYGSEYLYDLEIIEDRIFSCGKSNSYGNDTYDGYLLITDLEGNILINGKKNIGDSFSLFPNPANNHIDIVFNQVLECDSVNFILFDMGGKIIYQSSYSYINRIPIDVSPFPSGVYIYSLFGKCIDPKKGKLIIAR